VDDDFDFDDMGLDGGSDDFNSDDFDMGSNSDDLGVQNESPNNAEGNRSTRKTALVAIVCGVVLIALVFGILAVVNKLNSNGDTAESQVNTVDSSNNVVYTPVEDTSSSQTQNGIVSNSSSAQSNVSSSSSSNDGWIEFDTIDDQIVFDDEYLDTIFTITSLQHSVKVLGIENLIMKTKIYGILSGFEGTYELDIPVSSGYNMSTGDKLNVSVHVGHMTDGTTVIDDIQIVG
jgi:hypothetical protein